MHLKSYISHYYLWRLKPAITLENSWHGVSLTNSTDMGGSMGLDNIQGGPFFIQTNIKLLKARPVPDYKVVKLTAERVVSNLATELIKTVETTSTRKLDGTTGRVTHKNFRRIVQVSTQNYSFATMTQSSVEEGIPLSKSVS
jgi:hypothetical protein